MPRQVREYCSFEVLDFAKSTNSLFDGHDFGTDTDTGADNLTTTGSAGNFTITFTGAKANTNMTQVFGDAATAFSGTTSQTITTTYNNAGEVASISDPAATINFTRDNLGRATTVSNIHAGLTPVVAFNQAM